MMKIPFFITALLLTQAVYGQQSEQPKEVRESDKAFENYCVSHALQRIVVLPGKNMDGVTIAGEVTLKGTSANYHDLGIQLKENEAQYYRISGSNDLLKVESLMRLRLAYTSEKQK